MARRLLRTYSLQEEGLWNLFLPDDELGAGLSITDYAPIAELTGRSLLALHF